jgi:ATPase family associated with various cellular activities (AAA)
LMMIDPPMKPVTDVPVATLLDEALRLAPTAVPYRLGASLAAAFPDRTVLETEDADFDPPRFARHGHAAVEWHETIHSQRVTEWRREQPHLSEHPGSAWMRVRWEGHAVDVVRAEWQAGFNQTHRWWIVAGTRELAERFLSAVCAFCHLPRQEILVFNGGCWSRSRSMYDAIQRSSFDDIVLAGALKDEIRGDLERFLRAREDYARYRVPWKRGILFVGPPGNGKTHCLRASLRLLDVPCLYVQSLATRYETEDHCIRQVFGHARELTPCCLVFEDLDAMITPKNRSFFLNQLDGFEQNDGILTIATTNHADRLDPAIVDRPSRFDRKYHFELPARPERRAYTEMWNARLDPAMRVTDEAAIARLAEDTEGFSFAYVKELFVSSMVRWMAGSRERPLLPILFDQLGLLRHQMRTEPAPSTAVASAVVGDDAED